MPSKEVLRLEAAHYRRMTDKLKASYGALEDDVLADILQGLSDLPEIIEELIRSSLDDDALAQGLKLRIDTMHERLTRFRSRHQKKRELARWVMESAGVTKLEAVDFAVSLSEGGQRLEVSDEGRIPFAYLIPQAPKIDRTALLAALKRGEHIEGASLVVGASFIVVRCR